MLQQLRDKAKSLVSFVLLILLVISFGIWGIGDIFRNRGGGSDWVAKVGHIKIPPQLLEQEFRKQVAQLRGVLGSDFSTEKAKQAGIMERALDQIISTAATDQEINRLGLHVGNQPIIATLEQTPQLRNPDGTFNREMFERVLASQGMNEASFLDQQRRILARNILARSLALPVNVPNLAVNDFAKATAQRRVAELVRINADALPVPAPSDDILQQFYKDNAGNYKTLERRSFSELRLNPADVAKTISVTDDELKAAYEADQAQFDQPEKRDIVQVVLDNEDKAKELAAAAHQNSLPNAAKDAGVETVSLDQLAKKDLPEALANAVFQKGIGQIGGPVQTNMGWHVFVVEKITPARKQNFVEVAPSLRAKLQNDKAADSLVQTANKIDDMLAGGKSLEDIAGKFGLKLDKMADQEAPAKSAQPNDKTADAEALKAAFSQNEGEVSPLMETKEGGYVVVRTDKINTSHAEEFAALKDRLKTDWQKAQRARQAEQTGEKVAEQMKKGAPLGEISGPGVSKTTSQPVRIDEWQNSGIPREALEPLFNLSKGEVALVTTGTGDVVLRVKNILPGSDKDVQNRKAAVQKHIADDWLMLHLDEFNQALRKYYPVEIDQKTLARMTAQE